MHCAGHSPRRTRPIKHILQMKNSHALHCTLHTQQKGALRSRLHAPHVAFHIPHSTLNTLHIVLSSHKAFHTLHFTLRAPHFPPYTLHSTLYTPHSPRQTPHPTPPQLTFYNPRFTPTSALRGSAHRPLHTLGNLRALRSLLYTLRSTQLTVHPTLALSQRHHTPLCTPHSTLDPPKHCAFCRLPSTLHTPHSPLHTPHSTLRTLTPCSTLHTLHFAPSPPAPHSTL